MLHIRTPLFRRRKLELAQCGCTSAREIAVAEVLADVGCCEEERRPQGLPGASREFISHALSTKGINIRRHERVVVFKCTVKGEVGILVLWKDALDFFIELVRFHD